MAKAAEFAKADPVFAVLDRARMPYSVLAGPYKVVFLAFPFEEYGTAAQKADLLTKAKNFFGP